MTFSCFTLTTISIKHTFTFYLWLLKLESSPAKRWWVSGGRAWWWSRRWTRWPWSVARWWRHLQMIPVICAVLAVRSLSASVIPTRYGRLWFWFSYPQGSPSSGAALPTRQHQSSKANSKYINKVFSNKIKRKRITGCSIPHILLCSTKSIIGWHTRVMPLNRSVWTNNFLWVKTSFVEII